MDSGIARVALGIGLLLLAPAPATHATADDVRVGSLLVLPSQSKTIYNAWGVKAIYLLTERRPLLVVSWRLDEAASVEQAVPAALELQELCGEDLAVVFVERSGLDDLEMLRRVADRHWLCGLALWTSDDLPGTDTGKTPSFVLAAPDKRVVLTGDPLADRDALLARVAEVIAVRREGAADLPDEAHEAWSALHAGRYDQALALPAASAKRRKRGGPGDAAAAAILDEQARLLEADVSNQLSLANELTFGGAMSEAGGRYELLSRRMKGLPNDDPLREQADSGRLSIGCSTESVAECKASEKLLVLRIQLCAKGPSAKLAEALKRLAADHAGTHAAERALFLAQIAAR